MTHRLCSTFLFALVLLASPTAGAAEAPRLFVYNIEITEGASVEAAKLLVPLVLQSLYELDDVNVLTRGELATLITADVEMRRLNSCDDDAADNTCSDLLETLTEKVAGERFVMAGEMIVAADAIHLNVRIFDRQVGDVALFETTPLPSETDDARDAAGALAGRIRASIVARLATEEPPGAIPFTRLGWAGVGVAGVGVATLIAGVVTASVANSQASAVERLADGTYVNQVEAAAARDSGWAANGLFIAGGVLTASGLVMALLGREADESVQTSVVVGKDAALLTFGGRF